MILCMKPSLKVSVRRIGVVFHECGQLLLTCALLVMVHVLLCVEQL